MNISCLLSSIIPNEYLRRLKFSTCPEVSLQTVKEGCLDQAEMMHLLSSHFPNFNIKENNVSYLLLKKPLQATKH